MFIKYIRIYLKILNNFFNYFNLDFNHVFHYLGSSSFGYTGYTFCYISPDYSMLSLFIDYFSSTKVAFIVVTGF